MTELLKQLCQIQAVSGNEGALRTFIIDQIHTHCEYSIDKLGNIICFKQGTKRPKNKVMLDAHMDEVGLIVSAITADGFVKFHTVGGISPSVMLCRKVTFENGVVGTVGCKPVHLSTADERKKTPDFDKLYIDIGATDKASAEKLVGVGDNAVLDSDFYIMGNNVKARAIDDRAGVACLIALLKKPTEYDYYAVFSVQEEVGCRGAKAAAYSVNPDVAIVLEATTAADIHDVPEEKRVCTLGQGPAVSFMDRSTLYERKLYDFAINGNIQCQSKSYVSGGNNSGAIHLSRDGVRTVALSLPCRYIHSPSCVANLNDLNRLLDLAEYMLFGAASGAIDR